MRRVPPALAAALLAASCLHAAEPSVSFDRRVELDGELQSACASAPEGYRRLTAREAKFLPPATCRPGDVPAEDVPFDARAQVMMRLGPPPELSARGIPDALTARIGPPAANARWLAALRSLARSTAAASAFEDETRSEEPAAAAFRARLARGAFVAAIEAYTGLALPGEHRVFLSPFHEAGGVANVVDDQPDGTVAVSSLLGPAVSASGDDYWTLRVPGTLWHEESHGVLDPLAVAWTERIERARPADAAAICYGDWRQCVREHVVRAVMIRLMERELGPAAAAEQLAFENPRRFRWLVPMIASLKKYEADRARWPTLADYYPRLLDAVRPESPAPLPTLRPDREPPPV
ncbi:MAG: DUF4932 domain-containing protein, partial [Elusimicrobia bacterium]|nr:DUF4932 domain-containing protein [Elusimicrobiota bacterium]